MSTVVKLEDTLSYNPPKRPKVIEPELVEAEEEFRMALMGVTPRKRRLKIREKEIEMSNHPDNSTLYALSRDWVRTRYYRPPPKKMVPSDLPPSQKWDNFSTGQYLSPLVPQILPPEPEIINQDWSQIDLLKFHLQRWKKVAQTWKDQSAVNDRRYSASHAQLQEMAKNLNAYDD